jgi:peptidase M1-like protein
MTRFLLLVSTSFLSIGISLQSNAQTALPVPLNIRQAIDKGSRTLTGRPGPRYWQNHADYTIRVRFDPSTRLISGSESIVYDNNSPDTLRQLLFKLYPNLYKKGSARLMPVRPEDLTDGVAISNLVIGGQPADAALNTRRHRDADGTDLSIPIQILNPGQSTTVSLDFAYTLNKTSHIRTGQIDSGAFFVAYFFPRIAVYDDIDGWNRIPYLGPQEFYNDFCNFNVSVTVPGNYLVWATGDLLNRRDLLSPGINRRIDAAGVADSVATIIDTTDLARKGITRNADSNSWNFEARNVTDFVFATSNHYIWKASSLVVDPATGRRTRVDAVFNPDHKDYYEVVDFARKTVQAISYTFPAWPYPYPHETVFDGLDQMEYPMMVNDNPLESRPDAIELTDHEIFHTLFPFYMGCNETKYAWMDEGWATIAEWLISPMIDTTIVDGWGVEPYARGAGKEADLPIMTLSTEETDNDYYLNSYPKPAMGYLYLKDMLGDSLFLRGIHKYMEDWHGKHPIPLDFFGSVNAGTGRNLDWFWKRWFYDAGYPDLAITDVRHKENAWTISVSNRGGKPVPVDLTIEYSDGSKEKIHRTISVWERESKLSIDFHAIQPVSRIILGNTYVPDSHPADNVFEVK